MKFDFKTNTIFSLALVVILASCTSKPKSNEAEVSEAQEVTEAEPAAVAYAVSSSDSKVTWVGTKLAGQHNGTIAISEGAVNVEDGSIVGGSFSIDLTQIDVLDLEGEDEDNLAGHLKSGDFFDVENHPNAKFEITGVEAWSGDNSEFADSEHAIADPTHKISGNLTLRGNTLGITFPAKVAMEGDKIHAEAKFNIDRTKWGVSYNEESSIDEIAKDKIINNTVNVGFDVWANKDEASA
ncbi:MAG: YceI family protein [Bacteroidota bacterium]